WHFFILTAVFAMHQAKIRAVTPLTDIKCGLLHTDGVRKGVWHMAVQLPSPAEWRELKEFKEPFCLTMYVPHIDYDPNGATNPNQIELKNMLDQAETALLDDGVDPRDVRKTLLPAYELLPSREFLTLRGE